MSPHRPHAPYQALALAALLVGFLPVVFGLVIKDPGQLAGAWFGFSLAGYLWAAGGALVAAFTFASGDAQRPGWLCLAASYLVLLPARLLLGPSGEGLPGLGSQEGAPWNVLLTTSVSGTLTVTGFVILTRAWRDSGLDTTPPALRIALQLGALLLAGALAGPDLVQRLGPALHGDLEALGDVVSDLMDITVLVVAAPVLRAALALGGGLVAWPWIFLTAGLVAWLGYDGMAVLLDDAAPRSARVGLEAFRSLATAFAFAAGVSQRWVMTRVRRGR